MDIQEIRDIIPQITSLPRIWALIEIIDQIIAEIPQYETFSGEFNSHWVELNEIATRLAFQREMTQSGYFSRNGVMPYHTDEYASFKAICDIAAMWYGWPQNAFIGAEGAIYDEEGNEDISDMLPGMALNPIYS